MVTTKSVSEQRGFTLVELMVGIAVGLLIVAGLALLFANTSISRSELEKSSRMIESGRYATEILRDDIQMAGFFDVLGLPTGTTFNRVNPCDTGTLGFATGTPTTLPTPLFGYDNTWVNTLENAFCTGNYIATKLKYRPATDVLVIRRVSSTAMTPSAASTSSKYLQPTACSKDSTSTPFVVANGKSASFTLRDKDCSSKRNVRQLVSRAYYISDCNDCTNSQDTTPTLKMLELQGGALVEVALVEGIENMQLEYSLDTNNDGIADVTNVKAGSIVDDCTATPTGYCWANVMAVDIYLVARNTEQTIGVTDTRTYTTGTATADTDKSITTADQKFKRHVFTVTARASNIAIQREKP
jgi:type IV pilus assembly protein PilW